MRSIIEKVGQILDLNYVNYGDEANLFFLLNALHRYAIQIQEHRRKGDGEEPCPMPEALYNVQLDNVVTNKNIMLSGYISWLVMSGAFKKTWFDRRYENVNGISTQQAFKAYKNEDGEVDVKHNMYFTYEKRLPEEGLEVLIHMHENLPGFVAPKAFSEECLEKLDDLV
ncbi:hypothetical protein CYMTET_48365 [Cymbomonas tetramitiformis]|uniref:Uncharacterized protein n=1 Tax=Cymbomonas tetramitiformis TaxID=36881 RepID=A0AAE0BU39_9CHLO|nr:hypothetical protein CYMTET_48365 [Cymbomonas tetramitiformis]